MCENYYRETTGNCETLVRAVDGHAVHGDRRTVGNRSNQKQTLQSVAESPITAAMRERGKCHTKCIAAHGPVIFLTYHRRGQGARGSRGAQK